LIEHERAGWSACHIFRSDTEDVIVKVRGRSTTTISDVSMFMFTVMDIEKERPRADGDCCLQGVCAVQRDP
jgi:hypothetical protein